MPHNYYCTMCGRELNQNKVLFDLSSLITKDHQQQLKILKFRLTEQEIRKLTANGKPDLDGYLTFHLSFRQIMEIIANENNLPYEKDGIRFQDAKVAALTLQEAREFLDQCQKAAYQPTAVAADDSAFGSFGDFGSFGLEQPEAKEEPVQQQPAETTYSEPIRRLLEKDERNEHGDFSVTNLEGDLRALVALFGLDDQAAFRLKFREEETDLGPNDRVLCGFDASIAGGVVLIEAQARCCPYCGTRVFDHAGTAKHQCVVLIGAQGSGKTSVIVSLTDYLTQGAMLKMGGTLWGDTDAKTLIREGLKTVELLSPPQRLQTDIDNFRRGIAPVKTPEDMFDPYSSTLRIQAEQSDGSIKKFLLTLTDLPGELFDIKTGEIKEEKLKSQFRVAQACDALLLCFDTTAGSMGQFADVNPVQKINSACAWANAFQSRCLESANQFVPTMILFTKSEELEDEAKGLAAAQNLPIHDRMTPPAERLHMFRQEIRTLSQNDTYGFVLNQFNLLGQLHNAFHTALRISPFGYMAPRAIAGMQEEDLLQMAQTPKPAHIDMLAKWLLRVIGCLKVGGTYTVAEDQVTLPDCHTIPVQRRMDYPKSKEEALLRCILFSNPGKWDQDLTLDYNSNARLRWDNIQINMRRHTHPRDNATN